MKGESWVGGPGWMGLGFGGGGALLFFGEVGDLADGVDLAGLFGALVEVGGEFVGGVFYSRGGDGGAEGDEGEVGVDGFAAFGFHFSDDSQELGLGPAVAFQLGEVFPDQGVRGDAFHQFFIDGHQLGGLGFFALRDAGDADDDGLSLWRAQRGQRGVDTGGQAYGDERQDEAKHPG